MSQHTQDELDEAMEQMGKNKDAVELEMPDFLLNNDDVTNKNCLKPELLENDESTCDENHFWATQKDVEEHLDNSWRPVANSKTKVQEKNLSSHVEMSQKQAALEEWRNSKDNWVESPKKNDKSTDIPKDVNFQGEKVSEIIFDILQMRDAKRKCYANRGSEKNAERAASTDGKNIQ